MNHQFLKSLLYCNATGFLTWILLMMVLAVFSRQGRELKQRVQPGFLLLIILYFSSIVAITLVPLPFSTHRKAADTDLNFIPIAKTVKIFLYPFRYHRMALLPDILENIIGNVLMFIPFGLLLPALSRRLRKWWNILLLAVLFSCSIEALQWVWRHFGNYRHVDIDDVILNSLGAMIGFGIYSVFKRIKVSATNGNQQIALTN